MTEEEWLTATSPTPMLKYLGGKASERRSRLFATACCRRIAHVVPDEDIRRIVNVSDEYADGNNDSLRYECYRAESYQFHENRVIEVLESIALSAFRCLDEVIHIYQVFENTAAVMGHLEFARQKLTEAEGNLPVNAHGAAVKHKWIMRGLKQEYMEQSRMLRDLFGNPFRPVALDPNWRTSDTVAIAQAMYESRDFSPMPILADALQDAGCEHADVLDHCRGTGPHVRGCWVVDLVLGKA